MSSFKIYYDRLNIAITLICSKGSGMFLSVSISKDIRIKSKIIKPFFREYKEQLLDWHCT